jgi:biotin synthase
MYDLLKEIEGLFALEDDKLLAMSHETRCNCLGDGVYLRGIVEFSNICDKRCAYCGISADNMHLKRYHMSVEEILKAVAHIASCGIKTVVLQSGETDTLDEDWLARVIEDVKKEHDIAVTVSVGEKNFSAYKKWNDAGADRYLLKIETTNPDIYERLHPGMSLDNRKRCLLDLKSLGYETGSGTLIGLPGQTTADIAADIKFFKDNDFEMIGTGPFIPHANTPLQKEKHGSLPMVLRAIAATRIVMREVNMPATTAVGSLEKDYRDEALKWGANVLMPNFTPQPYKQLYEIYPDKRCITEPAGACAGCMEHMAVGAGRFIDWGKGSRQQSLRA